MLEEGDDSELVNNAVTGHCWALEAGRGFGVVYNAGRAVGLELDFEVSSTKNKLNKCLLIN